MALTPRQTEQLEQMITQRRRALIAEVRRDAQKTRAEHFDEVAGEVPDSGDESVATLIADLDQAEWGRDIEELRALETLADPVKESAVQQPTGSAAQPAPPPADPTSAATAKSAS